MTNLRKNDENSLKKDEIAPPSKTRLLNYMVLLGVAGFILLFIAWYQAESIIWNRFSYNTGSGWANVDPIYADTPLEDLQSLLKTYLVFYIIGGVLLFAQSVYLILSNGFSKFKSENHKKLGIISAITSFLASLSGFWFSNTFWVMEDVKLIVEPGNPGYEWVQEDLKGISPLFENLGLIYSIVFIIIFIISIILILISRDKKKSEGTKYRSGIIGFILNIVENIPFYAILIFYLIFTLFPVYITVKVSLSTFTGVTQSEFTDPLKALMLNYSSVLFAVSNNETAFGSAFIRSLLLGLGTGLIGLLISVSSSYALARFDFKGNKFLTFLIISTQMFPGLILLIPQYIIWSNLGLLQEKMVMFGILLASTSGATAYCTWMMKGYIETIPIDIEEAAIIDGAGRVETFRTIVIPLVKSGMVAVMLFTLITSWQDFVLARTFIRVNTKETLPLLFYNYQDMTASDAPVFFDLVAPYSILVALPIVTFFILLQKDLTQGAVAGSVK